LGRDDRAPGTPSAAYLVLLVCWSFNLEKYLKAGYSLALSDNPIYFGFSTLMENDLIRLFAVIINSRKCFY
jgi:hypothetical protein